MAKFKETLERHGLELRKDKCTTYCPTPEGVEGIRKEKRQIVKWTPEGFMILGTASDGEYRTEITTEARKNREPTSGRLRSARMLTDRIRHMCEADLECRRLVPAWKLVLIVLNCALSLDCCVVLPEALASYAQELDEIVEALFPLFVGQDGLEPLTIKRMRLPKNAGGFDATPVLLRSPMAFQAQHLAIAPSVAKTAGVRALEKVRIVAAARNVQGRLRFMGLSIDERGYRERVTPRTKRWTLPVWVTEHRKRRKQPLAEAATKTEPLGGLCCSPVSIGRRRERTVAHDERRTGMCPAR